MINTIELQNKVSNYTKNCIEHRTEPTYHGLSIVLGVSHQTISNVAHGTYNGKLYTEKPHPMRCIDNNDFEIIQGVFNNI